MTQVSWWCHNCHEVHIGPCLKYPVMVTTSGNTQDPPGLSTQHICQASGIHVFYEDKCIHCGAFKWQARKDPFDSPEGATNCCMTCEDTARKLEVFKAWLFDRDQSAYDHKIDALEAMDKLRELGL